MLQLVARRDDDVQKQIQLGPKTKGISKKKEQLAVVVCYVNLETAKIHEWFLTYVEATSLTAESLAFYILETLTKYRLEAKLIWYRRVTMEQVL